MNNSLIYRNILKRLLKENNSLDAIVTKIAKEMMQSDSEATSQEILTSYKSNLLKLPIDKSESLFKNFALNAFKAFVRENLDEFRKILAGEKTFKFLGSGSYGDAFDLGDRVLKIEVINKEDMDFSSQKRADLNSEYLWDVQDNTASRVTMVYNDGEFNFLGQKYSWSVMEKFETLSRDDLKYTFDSILRKVANDLKNGLSIKEIYTKHTKSSVSKQFILKFGSKHRLKNNWFYDLIVSMEKIRSEGFPTDFHAGNIGIRRTGPQGTLVFFD